ncbi:substrate-binding domain-containing protein [Serratia fonticola]|jgi:putative xylitol transport system substrate-binding protein|uniref:D-ribose-binding periplasmic protein n=2 Tax=Serratia TaxID=613 RepID=A0A3S4YTU2_SERFO|nr:substrate-binding domain-containing protein [Serratia fonticola]MBL5827470.1 substrate-binding domain-containing protein [Serratia fonticola]MBL5862482.1 substrate-binding domain-containing protein [Serratia fonticola]CAI0712925.1 D-ribose-binding periplasmic protein precursor [Serratia fonticola]CAI0713473.1 D-ribose-binding periplasmic protein precursor [Serratia fonticola]CAI1539978.1 D-ribose-binding periplasmic protein precursor [Serratia fonticola]
MNKMTKIALLTSGLLLGTSTLAQAAPVKIAVLMYGMKAEFVQLMEKAAKEHPEVKNGNVQLTVYDGRYDPMVQNNQAETAIQTKTDAIIINPMDYEANIDVVTMANKAKIPVVVTNARLNTDQMTSEVVSDDVLGGYLEAKAVLQKMNCQGNVVIIEGPKGGSGEIQRGEGNDKAIAECGPGKIKVLERKTANWSRAEALPLMENWLQKHRGQINGVIAQNDEMALGAIEAIKGANLNVKDFAIAGVDGVSDAIRAVQAGEMVSILQDAHAQMQGSIDVALRAVKGDSYQPQSDIWKQYAGQMQWDNGTAKRYSVPWTVVTTENAAQLLDARK